MELKKNNEGTVAWGFSLLSSEPWMRTQSGYSGWTNVLLLPYTPTNSFISLFVDLFICSFVNSTFCSLTMHTTSECCSVYLLLSQASTPRGTPDLKRTSLPSPLNNEDFRPIPPHPAPQLLCHYQFYDKTLAKKQLALKHLKRFSSWREWF